MLDASKSLEQQRPAPGGAGRACLLSCWSEVRILPGAFAMNLLLAEDDAVARMTLSAVLKGLGYEVTEAEHGGEAPAHLQPVPFPIALPDWSKPETHAPALWRPVPAAA